MTKPDGTNRFHLALCTANRGFPNGLGGSNSMALFLRASFVRGTRAFSFFFVCMYVCTCVRFTIFFLRIVASKQRSDSDSKCDVVFQQFMTPKRMQKCALTRKLDKGQNGKRSIRSVVVYVHMSEFESVSLCKYFQINA